MRPQLLWITDEVPHPDRGGGSIRQYNLLRRIADEADVDLLLAGHLPDEELRKSLRKVVCIDRPDVVRSGLDRRRTSDVGRRLRAASAFIPWVPPEEISINRRVVEALSRRLLDTSAYDLVQVEHEHLGGLLPGRRRTRWAITLHNLMSVRFRQRAAVESKRRVGWLFKAEARRAQQWERRIIARSDLTIVMSEEDARSLRGPCVVVPNGVDLDRFPAYAAAREPRLIFSASFNYEPNIDGATWLCEDILPRIRHRVPGATIVLVGREPDARVVRLSSLPGVEAHFDVPDVFPYLRGARLAVVPIRQGSGTRLKALEAMAAARPIVGTTIGLEGLGLVDGRSAVIADSPDGLAAAAVRLLTDDAAAAAIAAEGRLVAERRFSWDLVARRYLDEVVGSALAGPARPAANYYEKP